MDSTESVILRSSLSVEFGLRGIVTAKVWLSYLKTSRAYLLFPAGSGTATTGERTVISVSGTFQRLAAVAVADPGVPTFLARVAVAALRMPSAVATAADAGADADADGLGQDIADRDRTQRRCRGLSGDSRPRLLGGRPLLGPSPPWVRRSSAGPLPRRLP